MIFDRAMPNASSVKRLQSKLKKWMTRKIHPLIDRIREFSFESAEWLHAALTYMARQPLFVVKRVKSNNRQEPTNLLAKNDEPALILKSTRALWLWSAVSTLCVSSTLTALFEFALLGSVVGVLWIGLSVALGGRRNSPALKSMSNATAYADSPRTSRWKKFSTWTPAAIFSALGSLYAALSTSLVDDPPRSYGALPFLVVAVVIGCLLYTAERAFHRHFQLPGLQSWYGALPSTVKDLLAPTLQSTGHGRRYLSSTWRTIPDIASELNTAGTYVALFSEDKRDRPIWRRSRAGVVWYFAPLIVPLGALVFTPLLMVLLPGSTGLDEGTKIAYSSGSVVWAAWSFCYFLYFCARDFVEPLRFSDMRYGHLSSVLRFDNLRDRQEVEQFFVGGGKTVYDAVVVLVVPAFVGFMGLFQSTETTKMPEVKKPSCLTFSCTAANAQQRPAPAQLRISRKAF